MLNFHLFVTQRWQNHTYDDRLDDGNVMSNELGIDEQRNWNKVHATFAIDNVIDKMFPDRETLIGSSNQKILSVFFPPQKTRFGILAWAKSQNLCPSHSKDSISLYNAYVLFLKLHSSEE